MTNQPTRTDPLARYAVYALFALALWAGVRQLTPTAEPTMAQGIIIVPTAALPTAVPAPALELIAPTAIQPQDTAPAAAPAPEAADPVYPVVSEDSAPQIDAQTVAPVEAPAIVPEAMYDPTLHPDEAAAALEAARQDLPSVGAQPDAAAEAASDAYQRRRLDSGAYRPRTR